MAQAARGTGECAEAASQSTARFNFVDKLAFFPEKVWRVLQGDALGALSVVYLDLNTDICNHSCQFCDGFHRSIRRKTFSTERLLRLAGEFEDVGVQAVVIAGDRGEPLMHPGAAELIMRLVRSGIAIGIYTNGTVLSRKLREALEEVTWLRVSADSASAKTHQLMHGYPPTRNDFARMIRNLRWFSTAIEDVGCSFILDPINVQEIAWAAEVLLGAGAHFVEYKPKYLPDYEVDSDWLLANRESIDGSLRAARDRWGDRVIVNSQIDALLHGSGYPRLTVEPRLCRTSLLRMVISTHGCYPCTPYRGVAERKLGDIETQTLREVLQSAERQALHGTPCERKCAYHAQNEFLLALNGDASSLLPPSRAVTMQDKFV